MNTATAASPPLKSLVCRPQSLALRPLSPRPESHLAPCVPYTSSPSGPNALASCWRDSTADSSPARPAGGKIDWGYLAADTKLYVNEKEAAQYKLLEEEPGPAGPGGRPGGPPGGLPGPPGRGGERLRLVRIPLAPLCSRCCVTGIP